MQEKVTNNQKENKYILFQKIKVVLRNLKEKFLPEIKLDESRRKLLKGGLSATFLPKNINTVSPESSFPKGDLETFSNADTFLKRICEDLPDLETFPNLDDNLISDEYKIKIIYNLQRSLDYLHSTFGDIPVEDISYEKIVSYFKEVYGDESKVAEIMKKSNRDEYYFEELRKFIENNFNLRGDQSFQGSYSEAWRNISYKISNYFLNIKNIDFDANNNIHNELFYILNCLPENLKSDYKIFLQQGKTKLGNLKTNSYLEENRKSEKNSVQAFETEFSGENMYFNFKLYSEKMFEKKDLLNYFEENIKNFSDQDVFVLNNLKNENQYFVFEISMTSEKIKNFLNQNYNFKI